MGLTDLSPGSNVILHSQPAQIIITSQIREILMDTMHTLQGIIGVINTPYDNRGKVDADSLVRYVTHYLDWGVVGFLITAKAAETEKLSFQERKMIARTVNRAVKGQVPVIGGASGSSPEERILLTEMLLKEGCDGILVSIPYINKRKLYEEVHHIASQNPGFLMLQDWNFKGYGVPSDVWIELFERVSCFKCLKIEVIPAGIKYTEMLQKTKGKLHVSGGWASTQMIEGLDRGVHAFLSTILPDVYGKIFRLHREGERDRALRLFYELTPILAFSHQHLDISIHFNKKLLYRQEIFSTSAVREPILPFDAYHQRVADELINKAILLSKNLANFDK